MIQVLFVAAVGAVMLAGAVAMMAFTKPDYFGVQRSLEIDAPPEVIFAFVSDLRRWSEWSPYEKLDPRMKRTYSEPHAGKGAVYEWNGNGKVGQGSTEIVESIEPFRLDIMLRMLRPFKCRNDVSFTFEPSSKDNSTVVTWAMKGKSSFPSKVVQVFLSMDKMVGGQFEEGLRNLKVVAETYGEMSHIGSTQGADAGTPGGSNT